MHDFFTFQAWIFNYLVIFRSQISINDVFAFLTLNFIFIFLLAKDSVELFTIFFFPYLCPSYGHQIILMSLKIRYAYLQNYSMTLLYY